MSDWTDSRCGRAPPRRHAVREFRSGSATPRRQSWPGNTSTVPGHQESTIKKILVSLSTAFLALGLMGAATPAQAQPATGYAVAVATSAVAGSEPVATAKSVAQRNAVRMAASYLDSQAFSRSGLIAQLKYEGFSTKLATYGVDKQHTSWKKQAAKMAGEYLDSQAFSRSGLIAQLKYEGFTTAQAKYGVKKAGL